MNVSSLLTEQKEQMNVIQRIGKKSLVAVIMLIIFLFTSPVCGESVSDTLTSLLNADFPYTAALSLQFVSLPPYAEERLNALNRLLDHYSIRVCDNGITSQMNLYCDESKVFSADFTDDEEHAKMYFSFDPENIWMISHQEMEKEYSSQSAIIPLLSDGQETILQLTLLDFFPGDHDFPMQQAFEILQRIPVRFSERLKENAIKTKIKNAGTATLKKTLSFSKEEAEQGILQDILSDLQDASLKKQLFGWEFIGKQQFVFYYNDLGNIIKTSYSGQAGSAENRSKISLDWTLDRTDQRKWDEIHLKCDPVKGNIRYNLTLTKEEITEDSESEMHYVFSDTVYDGKSKTANQKKADLYQKDSLTGTVYLEKKNKDGVESLQVEPDIKISSAGKWAGKTGMIFHHENMSPFHVLLKMNLEQGCNPIFPEENTTVQIQWINDEMKESFVTDLQRKLAVCILQSMLLLPEQDLAFINHEMDEENWNKILTLVTRE